MQEHERELAAQRLRQIAEEIGLDLSEERLASWTRLMESTVDGTRQAAALAGPEDVPAIVPDVWEAVDR